MASVGRDNEQSVRSSGNFDVQNPSEGLLRSVTDIVVRIKSDTEILDLHTTTASKNLGLNVGSFFVDHIRRDEVHDFEKGLETAGFDRRVEKNIQLPSGKIGIWRDYNLHIIACGENENCDYLISGIDTTSKQRDLQYQQVSRRVFRHNIRNDLNTIVGHANLIQKAENVEDAVRSANVIASNASELLQVADKIQTISRKVQEKERDMQLMDAERVLQQSISNTKQNYPDVEYRTKIDHDGKRFVGNELIGIAIENALENAAFHNTSSLPIVSVSTTVDRELNSLLINIEDNGPGIPQGEIRAIQSGNESQLEHTSGVGLWMMKWIVEELCGKIMFTSSETFSGGSLVTISLPMANAERPL